MPLATFAIFGAVYYVDELLQNSFSQCFNCLVPRAFTPKFSSISNSLEYVQFFYHQYSSTFHTSSSFGILLHIILVYAFYLQKDNQIT